MSMLSEKLAAIRAIDVKTLTNEDCSRLLKDDSFGLFARYMKVQEKTGNSVFSYTGQAAALASTDLADVILENTNAQFRVATALEKIITQNTEIALQLNSILSHVKTNDEK